MVNLPDRKHIRLRDYDYSKPGYYFITICTYQRKPILGYIPKSNAFNLGQSLCKLTDYGETALQQWDELANRYPFINPEKFIVMPNHIHGIITINPAERQEQSPCPTIFDIICTYKSLTTKLCNQKDNIMGRQIWQARFHDHIIRNESEYQEIWDYIDTNPLKWELDRYYCY